MTADSVAPPPYVRNNPIYAQHPNGCGLASLLMLLDLPKNPEIEQFLEACWEKLTPVYGAIEYSRPELRWAIVLQYILLKVLGYGDKENIYEFFMNRIDYAFEDQRIMNRFTQEQARDQLIKQQKMLEAFTYLHYIEDHDYITPHLLSRNLHTMKTDMELKILAEIFNFKFEFQESEDNTGAIYFSPKEIHSPIPKSAQKKYMILEKYAKNPDYITLLGKHHHWLAMNGVYRENYEEVPDAGKNKSWDLPDLIYDMNDPAAVKRIAYGMQMLTLTDRFYLFSKRPKADYKVFKLILDAIEQDQDEEVKRWKKYEEQKRAAQAETRQKKSTAKKDEDAD
jgi:hypothetical protein